MKQTEIKISGAYGQKGFKKNIVKVLILAVVSVLSAFLAMRCMCVLYEKLNFEDTLRNIVLVASCCITMMCVSEIIKSFVKLENWAQSLLYFVMSVLIGLWFFEDACGVMIPYCWFPEYGFTANMIILCVVHAVFTAVIFVITLYLNTLCGKLKRKLQNRRGWVSTENFPFEGKF